jgi:hypothetical protein
MQFQRFVCKLSSLIHIERKFKAGSARQIHQSLDRFLIDSWIGGKNIIF